MRIFLVAITFLSCLIQGEVYAGKITIKGSAKGFESKSISCRYFLDGISLSQAEISRSKVNPDGKFEMQFELENPDYINIYIAGKKAALYAEPGKIYNVQLGNIDNSPALEQRLSLKFNYPEKNELNQLILGFIDEYSTFLVENEKAFLSKRVSQEISAFKRKMQDNYQNERNEYFQQYLTYTLAALEDGLGLQKERNYKNIIAKHPIRVRHFEYMQFFRQYFQGMFLDLAFGKKGLKFQASINNKFSRKALKEIVQENGKFQGKDSLTELFILNGLKEAYFNTKTFKQDKVIEAIALWGKTSNYDFIKSSASNTFAELLHLKKGSQAPDFEMLRMDGSPLKLSKLTGKAIYLHFWTERSAASVKEMILLQQLQEKFSNKVEIVSINMDDDNSNSWKKFNKSYPWVFAKSKDKFSLAEVYEVYAYPTFVLIDNKGKIFRYPAPAPSSGQVEQLFMELN